MPSQSIMCRYCGQELVFETKPEPFLFPIPCRRCRYVTAVEASTIPLTLHQIYRDHLRGLTPPSLAPSDDGKTVVGYLRVIADTLLAAVIEQIRIDLPIARSSLVSVFSRRERLLQERILRTHQFDPSLEGRLFPKVALLLWSVVAQTGGLSPDVVRNFNSKGVARFLGWFQPIGDDITLLAQTARQIRRGELQPRFDGSVFTFSKTPLHTAALESTINSKQLQRETARPMHIEEVFSFEEIECQRLVLGFTAKDMTDLFLNGLENLKAHTEIMSERDIYWVRLPKNNPTLFRLLSSCTLTPEKLAKFRSPFFFDLGVPAEPAMSDRDALLNVAADNWAFYYPFCSMSEAYGAPEYLATSHSLLVGFLANLESQKNTLAEQLVKASRRNGDSSVTREVSMLNDRRCRAIETAVCDIARSRGWFAAKTASSLPCGDIDTIAARRTADGALLLVVCEVKDADLPAHRDDAHESHARTVAKAVKQLNRKAAWVAENWSGGFGPSLFPELKGLQHGSIVKVLVTRNRAPFPLVEGAECIPVLGLDRFLSQLKQSIPSWFETRRNASVVHF